MNSIQSQINRLRSEESQLVNERNQARQELQQIRNQWKNIDRPRLLNMLFTQENQDSVRNGTLTQILDKFQNEVLNPGNQGGSNQGSGSNTESSEQHGAPPRHETPILIDYERMERANEILDKAIDNPEQLFNRPISEIIKDFRTLIGKE